MGYSPWNRKRVGHNLVTNSSLQANSDLINVTTNVILKHQNDHWTRTVHALARQSVPFI